MVPLLTALALLGACSGALVEKVVDPLVDPPRISGLSLDWNPSGSAVLRWTTDTPATSRVDFGLTPARAQSVDAGAALGTDHRIELRGLQADSEYYYSVRSTDLLGQEGRVDGSYVTGAGAIEPVGPAEVSGELVAWYPITLSFRGPVASETDDQPNPFLDYRLTVVFDGPSGQRLQLPGFFDGDGEGGGSGDVWRVRFVADQGGEWSYAADFVAGTDIAIDLQLGQGTPTSFHGATGSLQVAPRDPQAPGFYRYGKLAYIGEHYLKFRAGPYFIKGGADSPENLLGYAGFDNTFDQPAGAGTAGLTEGLHRFAPHVQDWGPDGLGDATDPLFVSADSGYDSKGIIGALNYLSSQGVNSIYFLPMNLGGDGRDTTPCVSYANTAFAKTHYDISKLRQWNMVFEHAQRRSLLLHFVLAETESGNEQWFDGGVLGVERRLFYREMVARFGHALAIKWNLSEENDFSSEQVHHFAGYIRSLDAYDHPIAFHTHILNSNGEYAQYEAVLGNDRFDASSIQGHPQDAGRQVELWRRKSAEAGRKWVVETDEQTPATVGLTDTNADYLRRETLYDVLLSGGHIEWYAGYHALPLGGDMRLEDFRTREPMWRSMRFARELMESELPFQEMEPADGLLSGEDPAYGGGEVFAKAGEVYAIYFPAATTTGNLDLSGVSGSFQKRWFDPRSGEFVGSAEVVQAGGTLAIGAAPSDSGEDWVLLLKR